MVSGTLLLCFLKKYILFHLTQLPSIVRQPYMLFAVFNAQTFAAAPCPVTATLPTLVVGYT